MSDEMPLVAVPNFSEGRNTRVIGALEATLGSHARVLNRHYDAQHNRSVFTLAAPPEKLVEALVAGAAHALDLIDLRSHQGLHPHVGALDVSPVVWQTGERHDAAVEGARAVAEGIAALGIPVFFYGELATAPERRERAYFRQGGPTELARRMGSGELRPDLGPEEPHPSAGATLVTAREPLVAFNVELDTSDPEIAREIAAELREAGGGLPGVRALGLPREGGRTQVSLNIHDPQAAPLAMVVEEISRLAARHDVRPIEAELVGLVPEAAVEGYPDEPPIRDFDPMRDVIENVLG
ncbi:MAG TPA: glutamate formimidoyltransferase [Solirubrobacterales bacterium]|nr:glutamate formimidoyltransferase [Solirubrobacterales bacterium]